ncbi:MAG: DNA polymerase I [Solirubrobacterales bacterium]
MTENGDPGAEGGLFLIDGNSLAYRAFFALPDSMATSDGRPTNAIFGLASMLVKLISEYRPRQIVVAWDAGMSGREEVYPEYKAHRPPKPDLLRDQWPHLVELVEAFGYPNVSVEGYEADDVIATLATEATARGIDTVVVTGDRDAFQLVGDHVRVMATTKGITETVLYDESGVLERYGVRPDQVTDLIGLKGDSSDNIPGVPGIGDKTAAALLEEFGTLEAVLENVDDISGAKRKENLVAHAEDARVSKRLATMVTDLDTGLELDQILDREADRSGLRPFMRTFELKAALERLEKALGDGAIPQDEGAGPGEEKEEGPAPEVSAGGLTDLGGRPVALLADDGGWVATDGKTTVVGDGPVGGLVDQLSDRDLVTHDAKAVLGGPGGAYENRGKDGFRLIHDTRIGAWLIEPNRRSYDLDDLAPGAIGSPGGEEAQLALDTGEGRSPEDASRAVAAVWSLAGEQKETLTRTDLESLFLDVELPLVEVLDSMERIGLKLDTDRLAGIGDGIAAELAEIEKEIHRLAGHEFTIGSPQQVSQVLFEELGLTRKRKGKTGYSTDARVLAQIREEHEIVSLIERWRELSKLKSTYLDPLPNMIDPATGRIHTTFQQTATATGRLSSTDPNLQNIPVRTELGRPIRGCFVAEPGNLMVSADYSQVELRVLAQVADDDVLKGFFREGLDVHRATAAQVFEIDPEDVDDAQRSRAKMVNFGIVYGLTGFGLADRLNIPRAEGEEFVSAYLERFPAIREFRDRVVAEASESGYVTTLLGRRRPIPELASSQRQRRQLGERLAVNAIVQGTAADIMKIAMLRCFGRLADDGLETRIVLQIHDELLFEGPEAEAEAVRDLAIEEMVAAFDLDPPLEVDAGIGPDWLSVK